MKKTTSVLLASLLASSVSIAINATAQEAQEFAPPPPPAQAKAPISEPITAVTNDKVLSDLLEKLRPIELETPQAVEVARSQNIVLTPEMIVALRTLMAERDIALKQSVKNVELKVSSERLNISSIQKPLLLQVQKGYDTFVEFYDLAGNPWPTEAFISVGATEQFKAEQLTDLPNSVKSNIVRVSAAADYGDSTMTIQLQGLKETVNFRLVHNQLSETVDYKRVFTVPMINSAFAQASLSTAGADGVQVPTSNNAQVNATVNEFMRAANESFEPFFTGDVPDGAMNIPVIKGDAAAWLYNGFLYVRSKNEVLTYPSDQVGIQSFSGLFVHKMSPYPLISYYVNSKSETIVLDDDTLMSAVNYQRIQKEQQEQTKLTLDLMGG